MAALQLEDKLTCAICLGLYRDPATLPCGHNFCRACIQDCWRRCQKECPECRQPFPDGAELCRNVALSDLLELLRPGAGADPRADPGARARCPRHGRPLELFCRTEGRCVCSACTVLDCDLHERALLDAERREREVTPRRPGGRGRASKPRRRSALRSRAEAEGCRPRLSYGVTSPRQGSPGLRSCSVQPSGWLNAKPGALEWTPTPFSVPG